MINYLPNRTNFILSLLIAVLTLLVLAACSSSQIPPVEIPAMPVLRPTATPVPTVPPPTATPLPRGGNLTILADSDVAELRPWQPRSRTEEQISQLLYSGLMRLDAQLQPQPDLATAWVPSPDGRQITFTLRTDARWHDGKPLTAADVAYTLDALREISPTTALLNDMRRIAEVTTPATTTVVISLTERYAPILSSLALPVLPRHLLIGKNIATLNFWEVPVGSGPFQFAERSPGISIILAANQQFYRGAPLLDRVAFLPAPNQQVVVDALGDGRLALAELPWSTAKTISQTVPGLEAGSYSENGYYFMATNTRAGRPLADPRVRIALAASFDLHKIVAEVTDGRGIPIASSAAPGSWANFTLPPTTTLDLDRAGLLLDEAGWKVPDGGGIRQQNGITLTLQLFVRGDDQRRMRAADLIADSARQVGINIVVEKADFETVIRSKFAPPYDFDLLIGGWSNGAGDPVFADYAFYDSDDFALFHSSQINQGVADQRGVLNITGFRDASYDNQSAAARQLYDLTPRIRAIRVAQERVAELKPYIFLWADRIPVVLNNQFTTLDGPINLNTPMYLGNIERWHLNK